MEDFASNLTLIVSLIAFIVAIILAIKNFAELPTNGQIAKVKEWLLYAVTIAEKEYGGGTGQIKLRYVYDMFVQKFEWIAKAVSFETFSSWVDAALEQMKKILESNQAVANLVEDKGDK